eukprot:1159792-Pelagomonas_calceolata.AAC.19
MSISGGGGEGVAESVLGGAALRTQAPTVVYADHWCKGPTVMYADHWCKGPTVVYSALQQQHPP